VYLNDLEAERLALCPTLNHARAYFAALRLQREDPLPPWKFFKVARLAPRRGLLVLAELTRKGWLRKEAYGPPGTLRTVRFVSTAKGGQAIAGDQRQAIAGDQGQAIAGDQGQAIAGDHLGEGGKRSPAIASSFIDPDLPSGSRLPKTEPSVRTEGMQGEGTDGRTDGSKKFADIARRLVGSIASDWEIPQPVVEKCVGRFVDELAAVEPEPTERELWRYFRAAFQHRERRHTHPAFAGIVVERFLGCACTSLRFSQWREHERKREVVQRAERERDQRERAADDESLTPSQLLAVLEERARSVAR
jgi:hypothetical protein